MNSSPERGTSEPVEVGNSIGQLLRHAFVLVGGLILLGAAIAIWQISVMRQRAQRLYDAEQPALAVLLAHSHFQRFQAELSLLSETHDAGRFTAKASEMRHVFNQDVDRAIQALSGLGPGPERERQFTGLEAIRTMFDSQMNDLLELVRLGDWSVVQLRSQSRDPVLSALSESLVRDIDELVAEQKRQELDEIDRAGNRAMLTLLLIGLATFLLSAFLGWRVTRTIGGRLTQMDAAVRALGRGEFYQRVNVGGNDEIGRLARVFNDMSARLSELYETLQRSEAQFRSLIENVSDFIIVLQADGTIRYASPSFEREAGEGRSLIGRKITELATGDDRTVVEGVLAMVQEKDPPSEESPSPVEAEFRIRRSAGGLRTLEVSATNLLPHPAVRGIVVNARDVTERRKLEEQLMRAQRMEAIGTLSGGIAHDFNNILTVILGHTEVLLQALRSNPQMAEHLKSIDEASRRASALTRQLLAFSRKQVLQPRVFNLNSLILDLDKMLRRMISEDIEYTTVTDPRLGATKADPGQIEQVVMNLVVNARDAIDGVGTITVETANVDLDEEYAGTHPGVRPGPHVMLAVSDTGAGIRPEIFPHIFEPFFTTKEVGRGTGLGLSTVYGIVKQSGGSVWVYSQPGRGTTFKVYLPRVEEPATVVVESSQHAATSGAETVLLVEDEPALRDLIKIALVKNGFTVLDAASPADAIKLCQRATPLHLLLTDVIMPGMDGPSLAKYVQKARPDIKVLYMSGYATNFIMHEGVVDPGTNFIEKPFHPRALLSKVREVLDSPLHGTA